MSTVNSISFSHNFSVLNASAGGSRMSRHALGLWVLYDNNFYRVDVIICKYFICVPGNPLSKYSAPKSLSTLCSSLFFSFFFDNRTNWKVSILSNGTPESVLQGILLRKLNPWIRWVTINKSGFEKSKLIVHPVPNRYVSFFSSHSLIQRYFRMSTKVKN